MQVKFEANMFLVAQINPRLYKFLVFEKKNIEIIFLILSFLQEKQVSVIEEDSYLNETTSPLQKQAFELEPKSITKPTKKKTWIIIAVIVVCLLVAIGIAVALAVTLSKTNASTASSSSPTISFGNTTTTTTDT